MDELATEEKRLEQEVRQAEGELQDVRAEVAGEKEKFDDRLAMLNHQAETLRRQIAPEVLVAYERLVSSKRNNPLAQVRLRICQGCHSQVTPQTINLLMGDKKIASDH